MYLTMEPYRTEPVSVLASDSQYSSMSAESVSSERTTDGHMDAVLGVGHRTDAAGVEWVM